MACSLPTLPQRLRIIARALGPCLLLFGCGRQTSLQRAGETKPHVLALEAQAFGQNAEVRRDFAEMGLNEAQARLGSFHYDGLTEITVVGPAARHQIKETTAIDVDAQGHRSVKIETPRGRIEQIWMGDTVFVRFGQGEMRQKSPREMNPEELGDQGFDALRQALVVLGPLAWESPTEARVGALKTLRFSATQSSASSDEPGLDNKDRPLSRLPKTLLGAWREGASVVRMAARVDLDARTSVLVDAKIEAQFRVSLKAAETLEITLTHERHLSNIGSIAARKPPARSVPEFRRLLHDRNVLAFFQDALPKKTKSGVTGAASEESGADGPSDLAPAGAADGPDGSAEGAEAADDAVLE